MVAVLAHEPWGAPETQKAHTPFVRGICQHKDVAPFLANHKVIHKVIKKKQVCACVYFSLLDRETNK